MRPQTEMPAAICQLPLQNNPRSGKVSDHRTDDVLPGGAVRGIVVPTGGNMTRHRIYSTSFASVYPLYVAKVEKKGRTKAEVDEIIRWLTGYDQAGLERVLSAKTDFEAFFAEAPAMNPARGLITGVVCGVRVEEIEQPLMREIRDLDKRIDELANGRPLAKILRR